MSAAVSPVAAPAPAGAATRAILPPGVPPIRPEGVDIDALARLELPVLSGLAIRAAELARDYSTPARTIAQAIGCDPVLSARLLRTANSPLYSLGRPIGTLAQAVTTLGNIRVNSLVLAFATSDVIHGKGPLSRVEKALWRHSIAVAVTAREITRLLGYREAEEAFLCGLLHDIGKLLLSRHDAAAYEKVVACSDEAEMLRRERELFGTTHSMAGAMVAHRWALPDAVVYAISHHHQPGEAEFCHTLVRAIDLADQLANAGGYGLRVPEPSEGEVSESALALDLDRATLDEVWERSELLTLETLHLFA
jgi:putative nucleotidyltransferase with HDIG domain